MAADEVTCERCGRPGRRRRGYVAPDDWYFATVTLPEDGDHVPGDLLVVYACSADCRDGLWTQMRDHLWSEVDRRVDVAAEIRRCARGAAERLRRQARAIEASYDPRRADGAGVPAVGAVVAQLLEQAADDLERAAEAEVDAEAARSSRGGGGAGGA